MHYDHETVISDALPLTASSRESLQTLPYKQGINMNSKVIRTSS